MWQSQSSRPNRRSRQVPNSGNEGVEQAWVMALAGDAAQVVVHHIRVTSQQFVGRRDPQPEQIGGDSGADVRNVFQTNDLSPFAVLF
jgi:hypothetical protein